MSRYVKAITYTGVSVLLLAVSWWIQTGLHPLSADGVVRGITWLFYGGILFSGVGVARRRGVDARFFFLVGIGTLAVWMVLFLLYGGMDNAAASGADTAANMVMLAWTALPLCPLLRGTVLAAASRREDTPPRRTPMIVVLVVWIVYLVLVFTGQLLKFVHL